MTTSTTAAPTDLVSEPISTDSNAIVFRALSDVRRLQIMDALRSGEQCVCDLQANLGIGQSLLSFHLKTLRDASLVTVRRSGRWAHYSLSPDTLEDTRALLAQLKQPVQREPGECCGTPNPADHPVNS